MPTTGKPGTRNISPSALRKEIERKTGKTPEQLYEEREKRVRDAIELKEPDRVPVRLETHSFPARYTGIPPAACFYDPVGWKKATKKTILDFEPDVYQPYGGINSGENLELLDPKHLKWPGGTLPPYLTHQNIDQEYMKKEDYDLFLNDPTDFALRYLIPRAYGGLAQLAKLPYLGDKYLGVPQLTSVFATPEFRELTGTLLKAGRAQDRVNRIWASFDDEMAFLGFPQASHGGGAGGSPFDIISDFYRGMHGAMTDMYRCADKLLAACDQILRWRIAAAKPADPNTRGNPKRSFIALHRGAEGFMSKKQFERFYWPGAKRAFQGTIEMGIVPIIFCEGQFGDRLEYFLELPRGKFVCLFDRTDMFRAKDVLRDHACIAGNVFPSLLQMGSPQEVEEYCAKLIKYCGKGGGFILSAGSSIDEAKPANIRVMMDSPRKYAAT
jgi:hypothetical protein